MTARGCTATNGSRTISNCEAVHSFAGTNGKCEVEIIITIPVFGDGHSHAARSRRPSPALTVRRASITPTIVAIGGAVVIVAIVAVAALKAGQNHIPEREIGACTGSGKCTYTYESDENSTHSLAYAFHRSRSR